MAFRTAVAKRLIESYRAASPAVTLQHSPSLQTMIPPNVAKTNIHREYLTSPDSNDSPAFLRPFLHRRAASQPSPLAKLPEFLSLPVGDRLREKLRGFGPTPAKQNSIAELSVEDARKLLRISQVEKVKAKVREISNTSVSYYDFINICVEACNNENQGVEVAKLLDDSGNVIVLGNIVFLRPEEVAKSMESIISQWVGTPNDPRREKLKQMEKQKSMIDEKARALVRGELYCGLGFVFIQTVAFMRLTFWELSWDVMEPICFFVTSLHFAIGYGFFLKTSTEPSFEGYFQRRFRAKQTKLIATHNFDVQKYNHLRKLFYPAHSLPVAAGDEHDFESSDQNPTSIKKAIFSAR